MNRTRGPRSSLLLLEKLVLDVFADGGTATRSDITARTGLSRAVVSGVVTELLDRGELLAIDQPRLTGSRGRPSTAYRRAALAAPVALIRLAHGAQTTVATITDDGKVTDAIVEVPWSASWAEWAPAVTSALRQLATPGTPAPRQVVVASPFPVRDGAGAPSLHPARRELRPVDGEQAPTLMKLPGWLLEDPRHAIAELAGCPALLVNDANLAALGEVTFGAARGRRHVLHVLVRDGIGAGLVIDGKLFAGANGMAGELAHAQVIEDGPFCLCGNRGCLATQTLSPLVLDALASRSAQPLTFDDIEDLVRQNDAVALRFFTDLGRLVARPLGTIVTVLDPDMIVIDSALGAAAEPFITGLRAELANRTTPSVAGSLAVARGELDDAVALGAFAAANAHAAAG